MRKVVLVGKRGRFLVGEPVFEREGRITIGDGPRVEPGQMALVELAPGKARVLEALGDPERAADVIRALLRERGMGAGFPDPVEDEARDSVAAAEALGGERRDLTELATFTIDPASARDFDDAISAAEADDGFRIWIHIADVAAHVRPGGALEAEALRRANSTYVPGMVEPMLPHVLSSEACSLVPGEVRLAVTAEIELSSDGEPRGASFYRSRIRSDARLTYEQIDEVFAGRRRVPEPVSEPIALARRAAAALAVRRRHRALAVSSAEPEFRFEDGQVVGAAAVEQTESHSLIEQLMVLTNERVAELEERKKVPTLYRVHEQPDRERVERLLEQLDALGIPTPALPKHVSPSQAGEIATEASRLATREAGRRGHGREAYTSLVLRAMQQAHYSERNLGHAGLGSPAYSHFTSPIRRFPDLIAHRGLLSLIGAREDAPRAELMPEVAVHCSERERDASKLERSGDDVCAAFLLQREIFERGPDTRFDGEVSGVVGGGAFVRFGGALADVYEGFLPARLIGGRERYDLDATETMLVGAGEGDAIRMGDPVRVGVDSIEAPRGRVDLVPVSSDGGQAGPRRSGRRGGRRSPEPSHKGGLRRRAAPRSRGRR
ncbi:MAG: VacB/RNase II family 3'-5' exoribonuclease [Actinobacteria bacterium]|nr:VacB/RNase II family 3'-5' exoribonuclease [Actinomycetota bacterium]